VRIVLILCPQTAKTFIRTLVKPDPAQRPTAEVALENTWLTTHAPSTEHDLLTGIRENFDARARWRHAIGAVRLMSRFANGARSKSRLDSSDEECEDGASQWRQKRDTPKHLEVPSPVSPKPKTDLATIAAAAAAAGGGGTKTPASSSSSSASFISIPEANKADRRDASKQEDRTTPPVQPTSPVRKTHPSRASPNHVNDSHKPAEGHADPHKEFELQMPGSFHIEPYAGGAAGAGAGPNSLQDAVTVLGNLWRRMQLSS
jgi:calcium/calmodulin-dependent protein kinase I